MRSEVPFGQQIPRLPAPNIPSVAPKGYFDRRSPPETLPLCCRTLERWIQNPRKLRETTRFRIHGIVKRCCRDRPTDRQQPAPHVVCSLAVRSAVHTRLRCRACPGVLDPLAPLRDALCRRFVLRAVYRCRFAALMVSYVRQRYSGLYE